MNRTTWKTVGTAPDYRLVQCRLDGDEGKQTYETAKQRAIAQLEEAVRPYLQRIDEIRRDEFRESGRIPKFKAWRARGILVTSRSQKRAAKLLGTTVYDVRTSYENPDGDWWYRYADEEAAWIEIVNEHGHGTGKFQRALSTPEAKEIIQKELLRFETMPIAELELMVRTKHAYNRVCSKGLPVGIALVVDQYDCKPNEVSIEGMITDRVVWPVRQSICRERNNGR